MTAPAISPTADSKSVHKYAFRVLVSVTLASKRLVKIVIRSDIFTWEAVNTDTHPLNLEHILRRVAPANISFLLLLFTTSDFVLWNMFSMLSRKVPAIRASGHSVQITHSMTYFNARSRTRKADIGTAIAWDVIWLFIWLRFLTFYSWALAVDSCNRKSRCPHVV